MTVLIGIMADHLTLRIDHDSPLSHVDRAALIDALEDHPRRLAQRQISQHEGDVLDGLCILLSGWAYRYKALPDGRRQILSVVLPGDTCCHAVLAGKATPFSVAMLTRSTMGVIPREGLDRLIGGHPAILDALWAESVAETAAQGDRMLGLGQRTASERICHLLCETFLRSGAAGLTQGGTCPFPLTQVDIADAVGFTTVHVNRTLQALRSAGLVTLSSRVLTIPDVPRLAAMARMEHRPSRMVAHREPDGGIRDRFSP